MFDFTQFLNVKADCRAAFILLLLVFQAKSLFLLRNYVFITQHLWEQNSHWMRRVEPLLAHILRSQTKFGPQQKQRQEQDKRGETVFGTIRIDDAWMAL